MKIARQTKGHGPSSVLLAIGSLLGFFLRADRRDDLLADLEEEYCQRAAVHGPAAARNWYISQILRSLPPVCGRALRLRAMGLLAEPPMEFVRRWAAKGFFLFATSWILCIFSLMHPPAPDAAFQPLPNLSLPDSRGFEIHLHAGAYDVERVRARRIEDCGCWNIPGWSENHLMLAALGPPLAIVLASLSWIGLSGARIRLNRTTVRAGA